MASSKVNIPVGMQTTAVKREIDDLIAYADKKRKQQEAAVEAIARKTGEAVRKRTKIPVDIPASRHPAGTIDPVTGKKIGGQFAPGFKGEVVIDTQIKSAADRAREAEKQAFKEREKTAKLTAEGAKKRREWEAEVGAANKKAYKDFHTRKREEGIAREKAAKEQRRADEEREKQGRKQEKNEDLVTREQLQDVQRRRKFRRRLATARQKREDDSLNMTSRQRYMSRMMMGGAGVLTAATMPISGFSPLTVGFASMSGIGFGVAAGFAVMGRAVFDISKALAEWRKELLESAESMGAVSRAYKNQKAQMEGVDIVLGNVISQVTRENNRTLTTSRVVNFEGLQRAGKTFELWSVRWQVFMDALKRSIGDFGGSGAESYADAARRSIRDVLASQPFQAAAVKPEQMFQRIQLAAMSRRDDPVAKFIEGQEKLIAQAENISKHTERQAALADAIFKEAMKLAVPIKRFLEIPGKIPVFKP
jgi:hypothetical protein